MRRAAPSGRGSSQLVTAGPTRAARVLSWGHVFALLLIVALTALTVGVAHRLGKLADTLVLIGASLLGGLVFMAAHPELGWVASEPDDSEATCGVEGELPLAEAAAPSRVSATEALELLGTPGVSFVDARPTQAYEYAHIPGAISLPAGSAEGLLDMQSLPIPPDGEVITYCDGGRCEQSEYIGELLRERDVCQRVRVLDGGWQAWATAELPVASGREDRVEPEPAASQGQPEASLGVPAASLSAPEGVQP